MYTLKGVFPEPKKPHKKNFIKENVKQLKQIQGKPSEGPAEPKYVVRSGRGSRVGDALPSVKSSASSKSGKPTLQVTKTASYSRKKHSPEIKIKKGDMAEFLKRKEQRLLKTRPEPAFEDPSPSESDRSGRLRDVACQTVESNLSQKLPDGAKLTVLYPKDDGKRASGDRGKSPRASGRAVNGPGEVEAELDGEMREKLQVSDKKDKEKDPNLPPGYQKGVLPRYLRERRADEARGRGGGEEAEADGECPAGHVTLPDAERRETLRMLRNSFAELVSELNKMPVRTDTLKMRNRKIELEKQLAKLEEGIKVFSRPKVFVKIGE